MTGVLWREPNLFPRQFFSAGKDGILFLRSIDEGRLRARETNPMALAMSCRDDVMVAYADGLVDPARLEKVDLETNKLHNGDRAIGTFPLRVFLFCFPRDSNRDLLSVWCRCGAP